MSIQNGMEKPVLSELPVISDRMTFLYLEHCRLFPAHAGVIPLTFSVASQSRAFPCTRRSDPVPNSSQ